MTSPTAPAETLIGDRDIDVRYYLGLVLRHRTLLNYDGQAENIRVVDLIRECVGGLPEQAA